VNIMVTEANAQGSRSDKQTEEHAWDFGRDMSDIHPRPDMASVLPQESPVLTALQELITKIKWHFDALLEWCGRMGMAQKEHRIDPDYDPSENDVRLLRRAIEQLLLSKPSSSYYNNGDGDRRALNWILGMVGTLVVSAVVGGIAFYGKVTALEERVSGMMSAYEARLSRLENINERRYREPQ
jgi:hypothetical protein